MGIYPHAAVKTNIISVSSNRQNETKISTNTESTNRIELMYRIEITLAQIFDPDYFCTVLFNATADMMYYIAVTSSQVM